MFHLQGNLLVKEILLITRIQKGDEIFKEKSREFSDV